MERNKVRKGYFVSRNGHAEMCICDFGLDQDRDRRFGLKKKKWFLAFVEFVGCVWTKPCKTEASKDAKFVIVWFDLEKNLERGLKRQY